MDTEGTGGRGIARDAGAGPGRAGAMPTNPTSGSG